MGRVAGLRPVTLVCGPPLEELHRLEWGGCYGGWF